MYILYYHKNEDGSISKFYRVVTDLGSYTEFLEILQKRNKLREDGIPDAWITLIDNKILQQLREYFIDSDETPDEEDHP